MKKLSSLVAAGAVATSLLVAPAASAITTKVENGVCTIDYSAEDRAEIKALVVKYTNNTAVADAQGCGVRANC